MAQDNLNFEQPAPLADGIARRRSFGSSFLSIIGRGTQSSPTSQGPTSNQGPSSLNPRVVSSPGIMNRHDSQFMSNSPTIANFASVVDIPPTPPVDLPAPQPRPNSDEERAATPVATSATSSEHPLQSVEVETALVDNETRLASLQVGASGIVREETTLNQGPDEEGNYSIRLTAFVDFSASQQGLYFSPVIRKIKEDKAIPIGRYTEKNRAAAHAPQGSSEAVVFKSKVVSRTHAQFFTSDQGVWYIKDLGSSSGTFLNHMRLSQANKDSMGHKLKDGDILQLGMDYRGGSEEIFRCIKMRVELNRSWQRKANAFNLETHHKLKQLTGGKEQADQNECAICLLDIEPCQAVFISPCSHLWHYKCIRPILLKCYPQFFCPNCRSMCDLETDGED